MTFYWRKSTVWPENRFKEKKHLKTAFSRWKISASPHFGRTWMTNYWLQVNFRGTPESSVVWRFKLAMWKVGGIKIESAAGRQKFLPKWNGTLWKMENFRKSVRRRKFSMWKFFRDSTMWKLSSRGFRKCGTFWACELLKWSYCCSKSDDVGRTLVASKNRWCNEKFPRSQFWLESKILLRGFFKYI